MTEPSARSSMMEPFWRKSSWRNWFSRWEMRSVLTTTPPKLPSGRATRRLMAMDHILVSREKKGRLTNNPTSEASLCTRK